MKRLLVALVVIAVGLTPIAAGSSVQTEIARRRAAAEKQIRAYLYATERFVDMGVVIRTVVADPDGDKLLGDNRRFRVVDERPFGGIVDTKLPTPAFVRPSENPRVWLASEDQAKLIYAAALEKLAHGSEGAGKSRLLGMFHGLQVMNHLGEKRMGGQTAPTETRLGFVRDEMFALFPSTWYRHFKALDCFVFCDGTRVQMLSTAPRSAEQGSPAQGWNFSWLGRDELQDQTWIHEDLESRGRSARDGLFPQLATATAKDSAAYRTLKQLLIDAGWLKETLSIFRSPFIPPAFLEKKKKTTSKREFLRRYGDPATGDVVDLPPELQLYSGWERDKDGRRLNLRPIPPNAKRITSIVLRRKYGTPRIQIQRGVNPRTDTPIIEVVDGVYGIGAGHDPGAAKGGTVFLDAFEVPGWRRHAWWVRGEMFHVGGTTKENARSVLSRLQTTGFGGQQFNRTGQREIAKVVAHPYGQVENKPSLNLYRIFREVGLDTSAAAFKNDGTGTGKILKDDRIEVINSLLCDVDGDRWLFVEPDELGQPVAPKLVEAFEAMERDDQGRAETEDKNVNTDLSDMPAALGYFLWPLEKPSAAALRDDIRKGRV